MIDLATYQPKGDKKNSDYFDEYRGKIYDRRVKTGVNDLIGEMQALLVQVEHGHGIDYLVELTVMTAYRLQSTYVSDTHRAYVMMTKPEYPRLLVLEPLDPKYVDDLTRRNMLYPLSEQTPNARYLGEIFRCKDVGETRKALEAQFIRFIYPGEWPNKLFTGANLAMTFPSDYTANKIGYCDRDIEEIDQHDLGERCELSPRDRAKLDAALQYSSDHGLDELILGVDHCATRILAGEREDALLEFLTCSPYYFWGAYNIEAMNSSTNVNRNGRVDDDKKSPAKVFTANNIPAYANSFQNLPMPTEDFVRNYGRRMHHIAHEVLDGDHKSGQKNIDYVVNTLKEYGVGFLAHVVGECKDKPDLKQIFSKHSKYSVLITEYIERCHHFDGFFTKTNVADLTEAAGKDERFKHGNVFD
jgi:hypothetical protein